jgi:hypothetical protein
LFIGNRSINTTSRHENGPGKNVRDQNYLIPSSIWLTSYLLPSYLPFYDAQWAHAAAEQPSQYPWEPRQRTCPIESTPDTLQHELSGRQTKRQNQMGNIYKLSTLDARMLKKAQAMTGLLVLGGRT